jgi:hypothetical protein
MKVRAKIYTSVPGGSIAVLNIVNAAGLEAAKIGPNLYITDYCGVFKEYLPG